MTFGFIHASKSMSIILIGPHSIVIELCWQTQKILIEQTDDIIDKVESENFKSEKCIPIFFYQFLRLMNEIKRLTCPK